MKLIDLNISGFGKFHDLHMEFDSGLNVIYGKNEAGKSTLHTFIRGMLFGIDKKPGRASKSDLYSKYEPWEKSGVYEGRLRFSYAGKTYRIERVFQKASKSLTIVNETDGQEIKDPRAFLNEALNGLSETAFVNTVSIGQLKSATDGNMVNELKNYIANLNTTGDMNLNISDASDYLKKQRREFEAKLVPEAAKTYSALIGEIRNIEREVSQPEYENQLVKYTDLKTQASKHVSDLRTERETLLQKVAAAEQALKLSGLNTQREIEDCRSRGKDIYDLYLDVSGEHFRKSRVLMPLLFCLLGILALGSALFAFALGAPQLFDRVIPGGFGALLAAKFAGLSALLGNTGAAGSAAVSGAAGSATTINDAAAGNAALGETVAALTETAAAGIRGTAAALPLRTAAVSGGLVLIGLIFFVGMVLVMCQNAKNTSLMHKTERALGDLLRRHLGSADISDEAIQAFTGRMDELLRTDSALIVNRNRLEQITAELAHLGDEEADYSLRLQEQQKKQWELEQKLQHLANIKNRAEQLNRILAENDVITQEIDAINLALETLTSLSKSIRSSFGLYLNKEAGDLISGITGGAYNSMSIDENLHVFMNTPTKLVPIEQVSSGTMDQIYLALRIAAAKLIQSDHPELLPLILDDSFALYDDERLRSALSWLSKAWQSQILLFTCHHREARILAEEKIGYRLTELR